MALSNVFLPVTCWQNPYLEHFIRIESKSKNIGERLQLVFPKLVSHFYIGSAFWSVQEIYKQTHSIRVGAMKTHSIRVGAM